MKRLLLTIVLSLACVQTCLAQNDIDPFTDLPFDQARETAQNEGKPLLLYVFKRTCGPCKHMNRTTWTNPVLAEWIRDNAIAVRIDYSRNRKLRTELGLKRYPETLIYLDEDNIVRRPGYVDAPTILRDFGEPDLAEEAAVIHREQHQWRVDETQRVNIFSLTTKANRLVDEQDYETALAAYVWLWRNGPKHIKSFGSRSVYMQLTNLTQLTTNHPPAMRQFRIYRNNIERKLIEDTATFDDLKDWIMLNDVIDEPESTVAWIIRIRDSDRFKATFEQTESQIHKSLTEWNQWALLGEIHPNPVSTVRNSLRTNLQLINIVRQGADLPDPDQRLVDDAIPSFTEIINESAMNKGAEIYAACLAANRDAEAKQIAALFHQLDADGSLHILLVRHALKAGALRERHLKMIDQAAQMGTERLGLRGLVEQMLGVGDEDDDDKGGGIM